MYSQFEVVAACANLLGECPRWHPTKYLLYWVDITAQQLFQFDPHTRLTRHFDLETLVSAFAFCANNDFLFSTRDGFALADAECKIYQTLAQPEAHRPHARFNDGAVDAAGRFWAGTITTPRSAENILYRLDAKGDVTIMDVAITVSNGIAWNPKGDVLYFVDSAQRLIYAYTFDPHQGTVSERRVWSDTSDIEGVPDGIAVDEQGAVWCAFWDGSCVVQFDRNGTLKQQIFLPVSRPTACGFGGETRQTLYITSAREGLSEQSSVEQPEAGSLFAMNIETPGLPTVFYRTANPS